MSAGAWRCLHADGCTNMTQASERLAHSTNAPHFLVNSSTLSIRLAGALSKLRPYMSICTRSRRLYQKSVPECTMRRSVVRFPRCHPAKRTEHQHSCLHAHQHPSVCKRTILHST